MVQWNSKTIVFHKQGENSFPRDINLKGQWECGLIECAFRKSWNTLPENQSVKLLYFNENKLKELNNSEAIIAKGDYEVQDLVGMINRFFEKPKFFIKDGDDVVIRGMPNKKVTSLPFLNYDLRTNRVHQYPAIINGVELFFIAFDNYLGEILGFPVKALYDKAESKFREYLNADDIKIDLTKEMFSILDTKKTPFELLYITSDIIEYSLVDNQYINLQRILKIPKAAEKNELLHFTFETPLYFNVPKNNFKSINFTFNNYFNSNLIPIETNGDFFFILHFRRIQENNPIIIETSENKIQSINQEERKNTDDNEEDPFLVLSQTKE